MARRIGADALLAGSLLLGACGFQPLYRQDTAGGGTVPLMAAISVPPPTERLDQLVRSELMDRLNPTGLSAAKRYVLYIKVAEARGAVLVTRNESVSRFNLVEALEYRLTDSDTGRTLTTGTLSSSASYNVLRAEYSNLAAEEDARTRATRDLAELIRARLALFFERGGHLAPPPPRTDGEN